MISTLVVVVLAALTLILASVLLLVVMGIHRETRWARPTAAPPSLFAAIARRVLGFHVVITSDGSHTPRTRDERMEARR